jgi:cytochrome bd-type quinol oxidase subunit 2
MLGVYLLIYIPIVLFVVAFLYETYLSFRRIGDKKKGRGVYVDATWEVTHTMLVFGVVMMVMLFTKHIDRIAELILIPTFLAMLALFVRGACYIALFYIYEKRHIRLLDWVFALSHVAAAGLLVTVVLIFSSYLLIEQPAANTQFVPVFGIGLAIIAAVSLIPALILYRYRD